LPAVETAGEKLGVRLVGVPARTADDFEGAFSTMSQAGVAGLLVVASPLFAAERVSVAVNLGRNPGGAANAVDSRTLAQDTPATCIRVVGSEQILQAAQRPRLPVVRSLNPSSDRGNRCSIREIWDAIGRPP
jgi:hypothetical protein